MFRHALSAETSMSVTPQDLKAMMDKRGYVNKQQRIDGVRKQVFLGISLST